MKAIRGRAERFLKLLKRSPRQAFRALVSVLFSRIRASVIGSVSRSGFLASVYFTICSKRFYREHSAVLAGINANLKSDVARQRSSSTLRRNIHRIEKGLIMRPRRDTFAEGYIEQTISIYLRAEMGGVLDPDEMKWAADVLKCYFSVVVETPLIKTAKERFSETCYRNTGPSFIPYPSAERVKSDISFDQLFVLLSERRSVRWYSSEPVPGDLIEKAISAASLASSACNRQPFSFSVFRDPVQAERIASLAGGTGGFANNIPCLIVVLGDLSCYTEERDRHLIYIDASLAISQFMLALQTLGLSTCAINWPDVEERERELQKAIGLKKYERAVMFISVGYADPQGKVPYSQKKGTNVLMREMMER